MSEISDSTGGSSPDVKPTNLDAKIFFSISALMFFLCLLLACNLFAQWRNYDKGIEVAINANPVRHELIVLYSRAMDFAFIKTVTISTGFLLTFVGALYLLRLNLASYSLGIANSSSNISLQSTSPGLVLVTLGVITVLFASHQKSLIEFSSSPNPIFSPTYQTERSPNNLNMASSSAKNNATSTASKPNNRLSTSSEKSTKIDSLESILKSIKFKDNGYELTADSYKFVRILCHYTKLRPLDESDFYHLEEHGAEREMRLALRERRMEILQGALVKECNDQELIKIRSQGEEPPDEVRKN